MQIKPSELKVVVKEAIVNSDERSCMKCQKPISKKKDGYFCGSCRHSNDKIRSGRIPMPITFGGYMPPEEREIEE